MNLTVLTENTTLAPSLTAEHGLSLYIETGKEKILFDMGQSDAFAQNAEKLGIDLEAVTLAVISHGHYDHGGGLERFLKINQTAPVYLSKFAFQPHFNASGKDIGLNPALQHSSRLVMVEGECPLAEGITLHTSIPCAAPIPQEGMQAGNPPAAEDFRHECYVTLKEGEKTVLLSGCSHRGIGNIAQFFRPDVFIGGFHLMKEHRREVLEETARTLLSLPTAYYTGHCTGQDQFSLLQEKMGLRLHSLSTGTVLTL